MKKEKSKQFIHWCTLGAIGGIFMHARLIRMQTDVLNGGG